jgi:hypothetical protein
MWLAFGIVEEGFDHPTRPPIAVSRGPAAPWHPRLRPECRIAGVGAADPTPQGIGSGSEVVLWRQCPGGTASEVAVDAAVAVLVRSRGPEVRAVRSAGAPSSMRRLRERGTGRGLVFAVATLIALLAAACGGDDASEVRDEAATVAASETAAATAEATATEELTLTVEVLTATPGPSAPESSIVSWTSTDFGIVFDFEMGADPFVLSEMPNPEPGLVMAWSMIRESELAATRDDAFEPRGLVIEAFEFAPGGEPVSAEAWVRGTVRSNLGMGDGELKATEVGGFPAVRYRWTGSYEGMSVAVLAEGRIWLFTMLFRDDIGELGAEYGVLLSSVEFLER